MGQNFYASYLFNGICCKEDKIAAAKWYHKSLENGFTHSAFDLGKMYYYGDGIQQDKDYGLKLIRDSADDSWSDAQEWLQKNGY